MNLLEGKSACVVRGDMEHFDAFAHVRGALIDAGCRCDGHIDFKRAELLVFVCPHDDVDHCLIQAALALEKIVYILAGPGLLRPMPSEVFRVRTVDALLTHIRRVAAITEREAVIV